jgi:hypothetical protein
MRGAGKIAVDGGHAQNAGGLRCVAVEMTAACDANVGHSLPPEFGCPDAKARCAVRRTGIKASFVKSVRGNQKALDSPRSKNPMRTL